MEKFKFTQEVKDMWLEALKSGNYKQGYGTLVEVIDGEQRHCCIGVLGEVHPELSNEEFSDRCPYKFLGKSIDDKTIDDLWRENDKHCPEFHYNNRPEDYKDDYSNVIPLIEALEVQE